MENLDRRSGLTSSDIPPNKKPKRGRGRPRKSSLKQESMTGLTFSDIPQNKEPKRGRGRPRKSSLKQDINEIVVIESANLNKHSDKMHLMKNEDLFTKEWSTHDNNNHISMNHRDIFGTGEYIVNT